jgi:hypothetical protein
MVTCVCWCLGEVFLKDTVHVLMFCIFRRCHGGVCFINVMVSGPRMSVHYKVGQRGEEKGWGLGSREGWGCGKGDVDILVVVLIQGANLGPTAGPPAFLLGPPQAIRP